MISRFTHNDQFELFQSPDEEDDYVAVNYIAPSVSPYQNTNPAFRVFEYNVESFQMEDYHQYYVNLEEANFRGFPTWYFETCLTFRKRLYSAKNEYGLEDLSPNSWADLVNR